MMGQTFRPILALAAWCLSGALAFAQTNSGDASARYAAAGQQELAAGRYAEARADYEKLAKLEPGVAEVHATLAVIAFKLRDYELAVSEVQTAQKLKPGLPRLDSLLGMAQAERGRFAQALPGLEKGFKQSADAEVRRMCGLQLERAYTGLKRDSKAVEVAMELNRLYPDDPEILYQTGKIYGNFAFLTMQKLARVAPSSVWRHQAAAEANESQGSYSLAVTEYRQVLALESDRPGVHYRLGRTLLARSHQVTSAQDIANAANEFEEELQRDPANANAAYELGELRRKSGQFDEAQKFFEAALKNYPNFEEAHLGLASVLLSLQKPGLALPHLQQAIELNAQNEVAWYRLGQAQKALGNIGEQQKALAEYRRLHNKENEQIGLEPVFSPREVTKQEVDPNSTQ
jgi:tetratricopeptide (TPR) repeat protein